ncbi:hypothetical protein AB0K18_42655 [Nonomuraea sp. NPDC049421]|uniref:hypothetical protein n=1 Tax=Nonomuraea sp. NPDC049421 TaxID=3155275 RepID=UPI00342D81D8
MAKTYWLTTDGGRTSRDVALDNVRRSGDDFYVKGGDGIMRKAPEGTQVGGTEVTEDLNPVKTW